MVVRAILLAVLCGLGVLIAAQPQDRPFVIRNVRVFDGVSVRQHQSVVVRDGHIESIGPADALVVPDGAEELEEDGRTLLPGLIDAHVHIDPLRTIEALGRALVLGVTTVVTPTIAEPPEGSHLADVKISERSEAHLLVGATGVVDLGHLVTRSNSFVIPTLSVLYRLCETPDAAAVLSSCQEAREAIRQLGAADAVVLAGTDAPFPGTTYDASLHWELEHLVEAGMTPTAALRAATSAAADAFQMPDRGRIAPGLRADLVLVNGDPTSQIRATRSIEAVWKRGVRVPRTPWVMAELCS